MAETPLTDSIVRAIVHLNFSEPDEALAVLLTALSEFNFAKELTDGHRTARI